MPAVKKNTRNLRLFAQRLAYLLLRIKKQNLQVFLYCFIGATLLWVMNYLNKERAEVISYPIEFVYDRTKYIEIKKLPNTIKLSVKGTGWQILRKMFRVKSKPIRYNIPYPTHPTRSFLLLSQIQKDIADALKDVKVEEIIHDTVHIKMDKKYTRIIEILVDSVTAPLAKNHRITSSIQIKPNLIVFSGPEKMVRTLPSPLILELGSLVIDENFEKNIPINLPLDTNQLIKKNRESVKISFSVSPYLTQSEKVMINLKNFPAKSSFYLSPNRRQIEISYIVDKQDAEKINPQDFKLVADYETFNPRDSSIAIQLATKPKVIKEEDIRFKRRIKLDYAP